MAEPLFVGGKADNGMIYLKVVKPPTPWQKFVKWLGTVIWPLLWLWIGFLAGLIVGSLW